MSEYITFEAKVEPLNWGKATYTIVRLPVEVVTALGKTRRVEGEFNEHPVNLAITRAPVIDAAFLWAGKTLLDKASLNPGQPFEARLRPAPDDLVEVPPDVLTALRSGGALAAWDALTPGKKRAALYHVETAKRAETRIKRIGKLILELGTR